MIALFLFLAAGRVLEPSTAEAQDVAPEALADSSDAGSAPQFTRTDWFILGGGAGLALFSHFALNARTRVVPPGGLDPDDIVFALDRDSIHDPNSSALAASDAFLLASLLYPTALSLVTAENGWDSHLEMWRIQGEALALAMGTATFLKVVASRPRPYTYLPANERPDLSDYDVESEDAFRSFPSGHAAAAWASSMSGVSYLAVNRPELPSLVHFLGGVVGGGLATSTSLLRVDAGKHFPTDVMGGALIGTGAGVGMSLLHRPRSSPGSNWVPGLLGVATGTLLAFLLTPG
jgi:membrane-associated phospholipid phosphatase